jgi:hypothetical protein
LRFPQFNDQWKQTTLGEILAIGNGKDYKHLLKGNIPVFGTGGYMTSVNQFLMDGESVFIGRKGTIDKPFYYNGKFWTVDTLFYTHSFVNSSPRFVLYLFSNINWLEYNEASGVPSLSKTTISKIQIFSPQIAEQEKIASFLSLIDERIQSCSETIKERKREKAALLNQLFSQKLRLPQFSDEWQQTMLGEIAEILNSRRKPITSSDRVRGDYPYYGASGIIDYVNEYIFDEQLLLIGEDGAKWGKDEKTAFIVNGRCWVNNHAHVLRFQNYPTYKLIEAFFFSLNLKPFVTGDAPPKLTLENLKSILIHFPSLAEQEKIADFLSLIDERIEVEEELLEQYERQKRYLLKQMFI